MRNGEYGLGIDVGGGAVSAAVCGPDGAAVPLPLGEGPVTTAVRDDGRVALVPADGTAGRATLVARVGDPVPVYAGGRAVPAAELVAHAVQHVRGLAAEREGRPDAWTVVTVPPSWAGHRCATLAAALTAAGVPRFSLVSSAVAAVAAHVAAGDLAPEPTVAVYDLGAGSLDTAVVGPGPDRPLVHLAVPPAPLPWGGRDVDDEVLAHVLDCLDAPPEDARALRGACRAAKEALSTATVVRIGTGGPDGPVRLTREELDEVLAGPVRESAEAVAATVAAAGLDPTDLDAVVLAGGGVRVPLVAEVLSDELGRPLVVGGDPALTPALGAAALAAEALAAEALAGEALAAEALPRAAAAAAPPTERADVPSDAVDPQPVLPRPRTPRGRHRPGSPPRAATGPAARRSGRVRRGAVVAGLALGLLLLGPAAAGLFDAVLPPGPTGRAAAEADDGGVIARGTAVVGGGSTARAAESAGGGASRTAADSTSSPRTSLAAAIATAARSSTPSAPGSAASTRDRTAPGTTASASSPSRTAGGTPSGTASPGAPAPGTAGRPSPSGQAPVTEEPTGGGQPTTSPPPVSGPPASQAPVTRPPASRPPVPDPFKPDPPAQQPSASQAPVEQTPAPEPDPEPAPEPTDAPATDAPATGPAAPVEGPA
ncbi:Hsp70 family protein [Geodermatophilus sp. SYSU D00779]